MFQIDGSKMSLRIKLLDVILLMKIPVYLFGKTILIRSLIVMILLTVGNEGHSQDHTKIDSLKKLVSETKDSIQFEIYFDLLRRTLQVDKDEAFGYGEKALQNAIQRGDSLGMAKSYLALGTIKRSTSELRSAIKYLTNGLGITNRNNFIPQQTYILNTLALAYTDMANYDKALEYHFQSLAIREKAGNLEDIGVALNNIGVVYLSMKDYENGLIYFQRSRVAKDEGKVEYDYVIPLVNSGHCYNGLNRYTDAIKSFQEVFEICITKECSEYNIMVVHKALGEAFIGAGYLDKAHAELNTSLQMSKNLNEPKYERASLFHLARIHNIKKNYNEALKALDLSNQVAIAVKDLRTQTLQNYGLYSEIYRGLNDLARANEYQQKYIELNESIYHAELISNIARAQTNYEERENLKIIADKDQVLELQKQVIANQRAMNIFIGVITVLVFGLAFVLYQSNKFQRKSSRALEAANTTIHKQNVLVQGHNVKLERQVKERTKEINDTNESLTKVVEELDHFIYKTSHDIRGPLASLKGICNVALLDVRDKTALDYLAKLDDTADKLNSILTRLLIINRINHATLTSASIDIGAVVNDIIERERKKGVPEKMTITSDIQSDVELKSDQEILWIVLENLIDNAIKFHNESSRVVPFTKIRVEREKDNVIIRVTDNGIGIRDIDKEKIFQMFVRASQRSETGGIGLYMAKLATEKLAGNIDLVTTQEGYTEFLVKLPDDLQPILEQRKQAEAEAARLKLQQAELEKQKTLLQP